MTAPKLDLGVRIAIIGVGALDFGLWVRACKRAGDFITHDPMIARREAIAVGTSWPFLIAMIVFPVYVLYRVSQNRGTPIKEDGEKLGLILMLLAEIMGFVVYTLWRAVN